MLHPSDTMSEKDSGDAAPQNAQDLTVFVQSLLEQMVRITTQHVLAHCSVGEYIGDCSLCCAVLQLQLTNICVVILCFFVTNFKCDPIFSRCITNLHNIMHQPTWHFRTLFLRYEFQTTGQNSLLCFIFTVPIPSINRGSNQGFNK